MGAGVLKYLSEITCHLRDYEHSIIYSISLDTPEDIEASFRADIRLIHVQMAKGLKIKRDIRALREIRAIIQQNKPDIIHLHSSKAGLLGRVLSWFFPKIRFFYTPHCYSFLMSNKSRGMRGLYLLAEWILSQSRSTIIACSKSEYAYARRLSWFRRPRLVENGMKDHEKFSESLADSKRIVGVGRLVEQKNPLLFIELVARMKEIHPDVNALWIGDGPLRARCEAYNDEVQAGVSFAGALPFDSVIEEMAQSAIFLQTSKWEGLPFTIIEAFSCGLPVVASDIRSHRDLIIDGENGFLANTVDQYVKSLSELLSDHKVRRSISNKSRNSFLKYYKMESFISNLKDAYARRESRDADK